MVKTKALDDRVGCTTMLALLEEEYPCDLTCVFTVQEEPGLRGAMTAAWSVQDADCAIALEGTAANDLGCVDGHLMVCQVGHGVAISPKDMSSIPNRQLYQALQAIGTEDGVRWQYKRYVSGANDAAPLQIRAGAKATCVLSVPCRYIHSPSSVTSFADVEAQFLLAHRFLCRGGRF